MFLKQEEDATWFQCRYYHLCPSCQIWQPDQHAPTSVDVIKAACLQISRQRIDISGHKTCGETCRCSFLLGQFDLLLANIHANGICTCNRPGEGIFSRRALEMEQATPPHISSRLHLT